jgi:DNA polymerase-3 subunit delta'
MKLSELFGLESPVRALRRALGSGQLAGTYLFVGPPHIGKTTLALAFAQAAACLTPVQDPVDACGQCESCRRVRTGSQPEIVLISPAGDQTQIWQFWDRENRPDGILQHTLAFTPTIGRRRVYILERADTLNEAAANSLLKVLEEPPPYALFILLAPHASRLMPTILSRAQIVRLTPVPIPELASYLQIQCGLSPEQARIYAAYSEGRTGAALSLARNPNASVDIQHVLDCAESISDSTPLRSMQISETIRKLANSLKALGHEEATGNGAERGDAEHSGGVKSDSNASVEETADSAPKERVSRRSLGAVLDLLMAFYRDLLSLSLSGQDAQIVHEDRRQRLSSIARAYPVERWIVSLEMLMKARRMIDQNVSIPLLTDWLATGLLIGSDLATLRGRK